MAMLQCGPSPWRRAASHSRAVSWTRRRRFARLAERVLEAQIQEDAVLAVARADADGHGEAGHDLQAAAEVVRPADAGADEQRVAARRAAGPDHFLRAREGHLDQHVERRPREPDEALPRVPAHGTRG